MGKIFQSYMCIRNQIVLYKMFVFQLIRNPRWWPPYGTFDIRANGKKSFKDTMKPV